MSFFRQKFLPTSLAVGLLCMFSISQAQTIDVSLDKVTDKTGTSARQEVIEKAIEEVTYRYINELIGQEKANKNKNLINNRILKDSGKYISYMKVNSSATDNHGTRMTVSMKISLQNLEAVLLREGLLYRTEGPPKVLPMINIVDRVSSQGFSWWVEGGATDKGQLAILMRKFHEILRKDLQAKGFYLVDPLGSSFRLAIPTALRSDNPSGEDQLLLANYFQIQILLRGSLIISKIRERSDVYKLEIKLVSTHANNGRIIGEVIRSYQTDPGPFANVLAQKIDLIVPKCSEDLATQIYDTWKSGTFGATLLKLAVDNDLSYQQMAQFKKLLGEQIKDIRSLKDRFYEPGRVVFELDSASSSGQLAEILAKTTFPRFKLKVVNVRPEGVDVRVVAH